MDLGEAAEWMARKRSGGEQRSGPRRQVTRRIGTRAYYVKVPGREPVTIWPGRVEYRDTDRAPYDVVVEVGVVGDDAAVIGATEVAFRVRPGGPALTRRAIQSVPVGAFVEDAVIALTEPAGGGASEPTVGGATREVRAAMREVPASPAGRPRYSDDELRFFADAYRSAPSRGRYEAIRRAYDKRRQWWWDGRPPEPAALRYRARVARDRDDPATGRPFLEPA
jgi:hypothetical protein